MRQCLPVFRFMLFGKSRLVCPGHRAQREEGASQGESEKEGAPGERVGEAVGGFGAWGTSPLTLPWASWVDDIQQVMVTFPGKGSPLKIGSGSDGTMEQSMEGKLGRLMFFKSFFTLLI